MVRRVRPDCFCISVRNTCPEYEEITWAFEKSCLNYCFHKMSLVFFGLKFCSNCLYIPEKKNILILVLVLKRMHVYLQPTCLVIWVTCECIIVSLLHPKRQCCQCPRPSSNEGRRIFKKKKKIKFIHERKKRVWNETQWSSRFEYNR